MSINARDKQIAEDAKIATQSYASREQLISITDLVCEGPIEGLVEGTASVYLNDESMVFDEGRTYSGNIDGVKLTTVVTSSAVTSNTPIEDLRENEERRIILRDVKTSTGFQLGSLRSSAQNEDVTAVTLTSTTDLTFFDSTYAHINSPLARITFTSNGRVVQLNGRISKKLSSLSAEFTFTNTSSTVFAEYGPSISNVTLSIDYEANIVAINNNTALTLFQGVPFSGTFIADIGEPFINSAGASTYSKYDNYYKFEGTSVQFRAGTRDQDPITNYGMGTAAVRITNSPADNDLEFIDSESENPSETAANPPVFRATASGGFNLSAAQAKEVDEARLIFSYGSFIYQNSDNGSTSVAGAAYKIELKLYRGTETSDIVLADRRVHFAKSKSSTVFEEIINLEPFKPFDDFEIKVTRLTRHDGLGVSTDTLSNYGTDKESHQISAPAKITSTSAIIKEQLNYPYTSVSNLTFSSKQFSEMPTRTYHLRGLKVFVPSNYTTREAKKRDGQPYDVDDLYSGSFWDGSLSDEPVYTNNPAWIFYDILTNNRYGLGAYLKEYDIDKYSLYRIGKYCDELVDDKKGGLEPRYTANIFLQKQADAYKVLKDFATSFIGMIYWIDGKVTLVADEPTDPIYTFSKANVIDGSFKYESTGQKTRANQIIVNWINPANNYNQEVLIVEDRDNIVKTGKIIRENATAFGCTSEGQAIRYGRWKLYTAINQTELISFSTSINAAFLSPGDVIKVQDADKFKLSYSGKVSGTPTTTVIPLDRNITLNANSTYLLSVLIGDDESGYESEEKQTPIKVVTETVTTSPGSVSSLTVGTAFDEAPKAGSIWVLREQTSNGLNSSASAKDYRIVSIEESGPNDYSISALEYYSDKYDTIEGEFSLVIPDTVYPRIDNTEVPPAPTNVYLASTSDFNKAGDEFTISWEAPNDYDNISGYQLQHNIPGYNNPVFISGTEVTEYKFEGVPDSTYRVAISTLNTVNNRSKPTPLIFSIKDRFAQKCSRAAEGVPISAQVTSGLELTSAYLLQFKTSTIGIATAGNPADVYTSSTPATLNTIQSSIADGTYYVLFDRSAEALKAIVHKTNNTLGVTYWYDDTTDEFTNQSGTVSVLANTTKVTGTSSNFDGDFEIGDLIKFSSSQAAKVTYIESDTVMYIDRSFTSAISGVTPARQTLQIDFIKDAILGKVTKSGVTSTFQTLVTSGLQVSSLSEITNNLGTISEGSFGGTVTGTVSGATITNSTFDGTAKLIVQEDSTQESAEITTLNFTTGINLTTDAGVATISVDAADNVLTTEEVQDIVGGMVTSNTESGITVTYQDTDGTLDFSVASQTENNFTTTLKNKLDGIAASANNYSLPTATDSVLGGVKIGSGITITSGVISANTQSDQNFTTTLKNKLDGIAASANNYSLPTATDSVLGGVKIGTGLTITDGVVSADTQSGTYSLPTATGSVLGGVKIGTGLTITDGVVSADTQSGTYSLPLATDTVRGGIELFSNTDQSVAANSVTTTAGRTYGIQLNSNNQAVVNVPWTDTTYSLPLATNTVRGGIELFSNTDQSVAANTVTTTAGRTYGIQLNSDNQAVVNVPWTDTVYSLPTATASVLGGVKVGSRITIDNGVISADSQTDQNFTTTLKNKLDGIEASANNYSLPTASASILGGVKVGSGLSILAGTLSADVTSDTNTTYSISTVTSGSDALVRLTAGGSGSGSDDITIAAGSNVSISNTADTITIASTDTNTTYSAGNGITLTGTSFSADIDNPSAKNVTVAVGSSGISADVKDGGIENVHLAVDTISLDKIAISEFPTVVWKTKFNTRDGSPDSNGEFQAYEGDAFTNAADNGEAWDSITGVRVFETDIDGRNIAALLSELVANKSYIRIRAAEDNFGTYKVTSVTDSGVYYTLELTFFNKSATGTYVNTGDVYLEFQVKTDAVVDGNLVVTGTITADAIAANTITASEIAANTITASQISANAITATEIAANTITASQIAANAITATEIAANTITASQIAADAITATEIATNAVTADAIAANTITASEIAADAITANEIAANAVTAEAIAANTITASEIAADAITATEIAANAVTADAIAANAVTADAIAANTITASEIAANTITASEILAGTITATEIAASAITAEKIAAGAITADDITTGTLDAGSITVSNLRADDISGGVTETFNIALSSPSGIDVTSSQTVVYNFTLPAPQHDILKQGFIDATVGFVFKDTSGSGVVAHGYYCLAQKQSKGRTTNITLGTVTDIETVDSFYFAFKVSGNKSKDLDLFSGLKGNGSSTVVTVQGVEYDPVADKTKVYYSYSGALFTVGQTMYYSPDRFLATGTWISPNIAIIFYRNAISYGTTAYYDPSILNQPLAYSDEVETYRIIALHDTVNSDTIPSEARYEMKFKGISGKIGYTI